MVRSAGDSVGASCGASSLDSDAGGGGCWRGFAGSGIGNGDAGEPSAIGGERLRSLRASSLSDSTSVANFGISMPKAHPAQDELDATDAAIAQRVRGKWLVPYAKRAQGASSADAWPAKLGGKTCTKQHLSQLTELPQIPVLGWRGRRNASDVLGSATPS